MRKYLSVIALAAFLISIFSYPARPASFPTTGSICKVENQIRKNTENTLICLKKGKKLVWSVRKISNPTVSKNEKKPAPVQSQTQVEEIAVAPKTGKLCPSIGEVKQVEDRKFTCLNFNGINRWSDGIIDVSYIYNTDDGYKHTMDGPCSLDDDTPEEWKDFQRSWARYTGCMFPLRIKKYQLGKEIPKSNFNNSDQNIDITQCKIKMPGFGVMTNTKAFFESNWYAYYATNYLKPKVTIQLIPIFASDTAKPLRQPKDEYGKFLSFIRNWVEYASDVPSEVKIKIPEKYIEFPEAIKPI